MHIGLSRMTLDQPRFAGFERHRPARDLLSGEEHLAPVHDHVSTFGWHIHGVFADPGRIGWTYTIGFGDSLGHPDLVVYGLEQSVAHILLNDIGDALADGQTLLEGERYPGFLVDVDIEFRAALPQWGPAHFGQARDWYGSFPNVWQVVLPDRDNRFPGEPGEDASRFQLRLWEEQPAPHMLEHEPNSIDADGAATASVPDLLDGNETGWEELLNLARGADPERFVVTSVPFVDHIGFGDEVEVEQQEGMLRVTEVTRRAPIATMRVAVLGHGDEVVRRVDQLIVHADANEIVWEAPVPGLLFPVTGTNHSQTSRTALLATNSSAFKACFIPRHSGTKRVGAPRRRSCERAQNVHDRAISPRSGTGSEERVRQSAKRSHILERLAERGHADLLALGEHDGGVGEVDTPTSPNSPCRRA